jgi:hypothetical protein
MFCLDTPRVGSGPTTCEQNLPLWAYWQFHFHFHQNVHGTKWGSQSGERKDHSMPLALSYQWGCNFNSLKNFQSCLTSRANTNVFLWSSICWISQTQAKIAYVFAAWNTVVYLSMELLSLLQKDCPKTPAPVAFCFLDSSVFQMGPWTAGGALGPLVHSSLVDIVTLCLGSKLHAGLIFTY